VMITNIHRLWQNENFVPNISPVTSRKVLVYHVRLGFPGLLFPRVLLLTSVLLYLIHVIFRSSISTATWKFGNKSYFVIFIYWWCIVFIIFSPALFHYSN
jgi:ABC-type Na+ efflux pump permease subunit